MKHLVIFLNHCSSRFDDPVYCIFFNSRYDRQNISLLVLPHLLDEKELVHEVAILRKKEKEPPSDVTFHLIVRFDQPNRSEELRRAACLIRKRFPPDDLHRYHCLVYAYYPDPKTCDNKLNSIIWSNLANISNTTLLYKFFSIFKHIFLYHDASHETLAQFLFASIKNDDLTGDTSVSLRKNDKWPAIFATFSTTSVTYPEEDILVYLRKCYVKALLQCSLPEHNPTSAETCAQQASQVLSVIPMHNERVCLIEERFIDLDPDRPERWVPAHDFWLDYAQKQTEGLYDINHKDWLDKIREDMEFIFKNQFRNVGVEQFYALQSRKSEAYVQMLQPLIVERFINICKRYPYTPQTQKTIFSAIVNHLRQKVVELQQLEADTRREIDRIESELQAMTKQWQGINFLSRMMKKDKTMLDNYAQLIAQLFTLRTLLQGCPFAIRLFNGLIPSLFGFQYIIDHSRVVLDDAIRLTEAQIEEADPTLKMAPFGMTQVEATLKAIGQDKENVLANYKLVVTLLLNQPTAADGEDLLARIETLHKEEIDRYFQDQIETGHFPPVLQQSITQRIESLHAEQGGLSGFIDRLKKETVLPLDFKKKDIADNYVFIAPSPSGDDAIRDIITDDPSHIQLIHLQCGLRITDLNGFSGQRMFIEPTLF